MDGTCRSAELPVDSVSFTGCLSERAVFNSSSAGRALDSSSHSSSNGSYSHPSIGRPFNFGTCLSRVLSPYGFVPLGVTLGGGLRTREKGWAAGFGRKGFPPTVIFWVPSSGLDRVSAGHSPSMGSNITSSAGGTSLIRTPTGRSGAIGVHTGSSTGV